MNIFMKYMRPITAVYVSYSSILMLVMLFNNFEQAQEKFLPAFIQSQIYVLPMILSALALAFLVFFEPDAMQKKNVITLFRGGFMVTLVIFAKYLSVEMEADASFIVLAMLFLEEILIMIVILGLFQLRPVQ